MTKEERQLILLDISARLLYGVKVQQSAVPENSDFIRDPEDKKTHDYNIIGIDEHWRLITDRTKTESTYAKGDVTRYISKPIVSFKGRVCRPYLRRISAMTEEEKSELFQLMGIGTDIQRVDFYNSHHLDYRGLIDKGLAIEDTEDLYKMSNIKENNLDYYGYE
jgi:hypothetical protein